jgi:cytochrome P450
LRAIGAGALDGTTSNPAFFGTMAIIGLAPTEHTTMRRTVNPDLATGAVRDLEFRVKAVADSLIDGFCEARQG